MALAAQSLKLQTRWIVKHVTGAPTPLKACAYSPNNPKHDSVKQVLWKGLDMDNRENYT